MSGGPVGWGCRIHWLHLCKRVKPSPNKCPVAQSVGVAEYTEQPQPTGPPDTCFGGKVLPLCRGAVSVFCNANRLGHRTLVGRRPYPSAEAQSVYSASPTDWATGHLLGEGFTLLHRCSQCILQPKPTGPPDTCWGKFLHFCIGAVSVFCNANRLGHRTLVGGGKVLPLCWGAVSILYSPSCLVPKDTH